MKKKRFGIALLAMTALSIPAFAQNSEAAPDKKVKECKELTACKNMQECQGGLSPFAGLDLSDSQKDDLKKLQEKYMEKSCEARKEFKKQKSDRDRKDREEMRAKREAEKKAYLADVKKILGPEKYVEFLEKNFNPRKGDKKMMPRKGTQNMKEEFRQGPRGDKKGKKHGRTGGKKTSASRKSAV